MTRPTRFWKILRLTPALALEFWLWEDDINTAGCVDTLFEGFAKLLQI